MTLREIGVDVETVCENHKHEVRLFAAQLALIALKIKKEMPERNNQDGIAFANGADEALRDLEAWAIHVAGNGLGYINDIIGKFGEYEQLALQIVAAQNKEITALRSKQPPTDNINDPTVRHAVWNMTGGRCTYCGSKLDAKKDTELAKFHVDHVVPKSMGGPDSLTNYVPSCDTCNIVKSNNHVLKFIHSNINRLQGPRTEVPEAEGVGDAYIPLSGVA